MTSKLTEEEITRPRKATRSTLLHWTELLGKQFRDHFPGPGEITAFRPEFAVHGKYGKACPDCETAVQRVRFAANEINYCPRCRTGGKIFADRSLSRLLKDDWPKTIEEFEGS